MKTIFKITVKAAAVLILLFAVFLIFFTLAEYSPADVSDPEHIRIPANLKKTISGEFSITTWNIGYCGLDSKTDFFMDGGKMSRARSSEAVSNNLENILSFIKNNPSGIFFLQESDLSSARSYGLNQVEAISASMKEWAVWYSPNYRALFVPSPLSAPMGRVDSGLLTLSAFKTGSSERIQLPGSHSWPVRVFHLKRCINEISADSDIPGKKWHLINLHLSAFDTGGVLRKQQLAFIKERITKLYSEGHFVVAGGDWNSLFPGVTEDLFKPYSTREEDLFWIQRIPEGWTPEGWTWAYDKTAPTCRTLEKTYVKGENFTTVIDGFLVSPNVKVLSVRGTDLDFLNSDHNPVTVKLRAGN